MTKDKAEELYTITQECRHEEVRKLFKKIRSIAEAGNPDVLVLSETEANIIWNQIADGSIWPFNMARAFSENKLNMQLRNLPDRLIFTTSIYPDPSSTWSG